MGEGEISYGQELIKVMNKLHCMKKQSRGFGELSQMDGMILFYLDHNINDDNALGIKISQITNDLKLMKPATSKALNSLEEKNYIIRNIDRSDRRVTYVSITKEGYAFIKSMHDVRNQHIEDLMNKLGEHDAKELIRIVDKLYQIVTGEQ
ncbi:MarR family winged helix-turn-helix transcriptional regulator [Anaerosporobacter sp.]|uniref:MarR family winged helix-turn-helix transcriptional regulator n=1 Tax=Anaerosporobacter sp. TaxID=1872529 RepID=UPI00286FA00C|nr:MarR family transcriptional regulator [Anaerosporobacter sp.]